SITKEHTTDEKGKFTVLKSNNIQKESILNIEDYDSYINNIDNFSVKKYINSNSILIPNLTYKTRASFLPKNCIADGSIAILQPKNGFVITKKDLKYYSSKEFQKFYLIGRNLGTRSLNIDSNSINLWGIQKERHIDEHQ
ncbi:MAG: restriction endonuclease, partial [Alphaproteobacteria bacterium]|nr:restriction endonuclease [Alphaproteobacteria bacterium]